MSAKSHFALILAALFVGSGGWWLLGRAGDPQPEILGKAIDNFTLKDAEGKDVSLTGARDAKA